MSWDIFVQDMPREARHFNDIPAGYRPRPLGLRRHLIAAIERVEPRTDFSNPAWGVIRGEGFRIELDMGEEDEVESFVLHLHGGGPGGEVVARILAALDLRAYDPRSPTGLFEMALV